MTSERNLDLDFSNDTIEIREMATYIAEQALSRIRVNTIDQLEVVYQAMEEMFNFAFIASQTRAKQLLNPTNINTKGVNNDQKESNIFLKKPFLIQLFYKYSCHFIIRTLKGSAYDLPESYSIFDALLKHYQIGYSEFNFLREL